MLPVNFKDKQGVDNVNGFGTQLKWKQKKRWSKYSSEGGRAKKCCNIIFNHQMWLIMIWSFKHHTVNFSDPASSFEDRFFFNICETQPLTYKQK